jgi:hypothetical protein
MSEDLKRVDQGDISLTDGESTRPITDAHYVSPEPEPSNPEQDTRIDLVTGDPIP